jgi:hypothetical protein
MQPESSDGFASVGTILPEEEAALLPGGFFHFLAHFGSDVGEKRESVDHLPASNWPVDNPKLPAYFTEGERDGTIR